MSCHGEATDLPVPDLASSKLALSSREVVANTADQPELCRARRTPQRSDQHRRDADAPLGRSPACLNPPAPQGACEFKSHPGHRSHMSRPTPVAATCHSARPVVPIGPRKSPPVPTTLGASRWFARQLPIAGYSVATSTLGGDDLGAAFVLFAPRDLEVRFPDLPRRVARAMARLARGESRHDARGLAVLVEVGHRQTHVPLSRGGRRGDLLRLDRLDRESLRRRARTAAPHTTETEEHVDSAEPTTGGGDGGGRAHG